MNILNTLDSSMVLGVTEFQDGWSNFWSTLTGAVPGLEPVMNIIGVVLVVLSLLGYFGSTARVPTGQAAPRRSGAL